MNEEPVNALDLVCGHTLTILTDPKFFNSRQIRRNRVEGKPTTIWCGECAEFRQTQL